MKVTQEPASHSHLLEKAFSPLISTLWGASSPHPSLSFFLLCHSLFPISHGYIFSCLLSISISEKSDWQRDTRHSDTETPVTPFSGSLEKLCVYCTEFNKPGVPGFSLACGDGGWSAGRFADLPWDWLEGVTKRGIYCRELKQKRTSQVLPLRVVIRREPTLPKPSA